MCGRDWSSDVCSSDLARETRYMTEAFARRVAHPLAFAVNYLDYALDTLDTS